MSQSYMETQELLYTVSVYSEDTILTDHSNDSQFVVEGSELMKLFQTNLVFVPEPGLRWMVQSGQRRICLVEMPRRKDPVHVGYIGKDRKEEIYELYLPSMVFKVEITAEGGRETISNIHGWCYAGSRLKGESIIYELPLPNFSGPGFCSGSADRTLSQSLIETIEKAVFDSWFNTHADRCGRKGLPFPEFVTSSKGKVSLRDCKRLGRGEDILTPPRH